ncbi:MAG: undecaprenyldiphospho-muramoylpentapeptide beta-N-acetylglucosaminyltransferase [Eubacteriales bacterium]|nr:undecaprenyldiphospho-muramoylpentapeptide beta-N-acetylglucosaminyltransferase [Eubacteriales bacterium]
MRIIMTGGGTGGHIYPAIAIADKIKRKNPEAEILFIGTMRGHEKDLVPKNGYPIRFITARGFNRKNLFANIQTIKDHLNGERQAKAILAEFAPDLVIGTGGYVCGPVIKAAAKRKIPCYLHEQNAFAGLANRMLEKYAKKVFLAYPEAAQYFKQKKKLIVTGNPLRKDFLFSALSDTRKQLGILPTDFCVLCFGGSLGAEAINRTIVEAAESLITVPHVKLFLISGRKSYESVVFDLKKREILESEQISVLPYADDMHVYLNAADLVISRSGALTVSEITACGKPSILIPSPNVTGNHQYFNAKAVSDKGAAVLIEEKDLNAKGLLGVILRLMGNREAINIMAKAAAAVGRLDSVDLIYDHLELDKK